jgi:type 1 fimbriae regulatory protein FimB
MTDRKHLSGREFERLLEAIKGSRNETRDRCLVLLMFRHGLRVSEACGSVLEQVDVESRVLHDARLKGGLSTTHPLRGDEIRAIKAWLVERARLKAPGKVLGRAFFLSEQRKPLHRSPSTSPCANTARRPSYRWPLIPTCCAVPAALPSPIRVLTPA